MFFFHAGHQIMCTCPLHMINQPLQLDIFNDAERREKRRALDNAVDDLRSRFGYHTLCAASLMGENKLAQDKCETVLMPGLMYK